MQRGLLIVKIERNKFNEDANAYLATGVHWSYGESLQLWLLANAPTYPKALALVMGGRISSVRSTTDWMGKDLNPPRVLYAHERGEFSPAECYSNADAARAAEEHITSHLFEDGRWTMFGGEEDD